MRLGGDGERAQIEAGVRFSGHPVFVHADERLDGLYEILHGDFRNAQAPMGALHAGGVLFRPEQQHAAIRSTVGLHALKALLRIMKHQRRRVQLQGMVRLDARRVPAPALGVVHDEHMVRVMVAEAQMLLRLCLRRGGFVTLMSSILFPLPLMAARKTAQRQSSTPGAQKNRGGWFVLYFSRPAAILQGADRRKCPKSAVFSALRHFSAPPARGGRFAFSHRFVYNDERSGNGRPHRNEERLGKQWNRSAPSCSTWTA